MGIALRWSFAKQPEHLRIARIFALLQLQLALARAADAVRDRTTQRIAECIRDHARPVPSGRPKL
jgi:hypothetical protein